MKSLYITSLKVPLLNALNIKINMKKEESADLLLENDLPDIEEIAKRIEKLAIFENVYIFENKPVDGIKKYIKNQTNKPVQVCLQNTMNELVYNIRAKWSKKYRFIYKILNGKKVNLELYDNIYVCSFSDFVFNSIDIMYSKNLKRINIIEGSIRAYFFNTAELFMNKYPNVDLGFYLYEKKYKVWNSKNIDIYNIKKLDKSNIEFVNLVNYIFNVPQELKDISNKIIFFDQVSEPMPDYLKNANKILKIILYNAYNKHSIENKFYNTKVEIVNDLWEIFQQYGYNKNDIVIKLHPRTQKGIPEVYKNFKFIGDIDNKDNIPWEIYLLNNKVNNSILITMFSTAVVSELYNFSDINNNKFVLLYPLYNLEEYIDDKKKFFCFMEKLQKDNKISI